MTTSKYAFEHSGKTLEIQPGETLIGSGADCAIRIEGKNIESLHAAVVIEAGKAILEIRAEGEEARVNGKPLRVEDIKAGDKIRIGEVEFSTAAGDALPLLEGAAGSFQLKSGENTVGRAAEAAISLDDDSVSREHASILALPSGRVRIRDLMSSNGTFVNDRRLGEIELSSGDKVEIGSERLVFIEIQVPAGAGSEGPSPPVASADAGAVDMDKTRIAGDLPDLAALAASAAEPDGPTYQLDVSGDTQTLEIGDHKIGRAPDCTIQLTDDSEVSRYHAQLTIAADKITVQDLGSSNGTRVNGRKIDGVAALANGDRIGVGGREMTLTVTGPVDLMGKTVMAEDVLVSLGHTVLAPLGDMSAIEALKNLPEEQRDALNLLELDPAASEEEIRSRFKELYSEFQVRTTNAPTPELRQKYERRIIELREAVEVLIPPEASSADLPSSEPVAAPVGDEALEPQSPQESIQAAEGVDYSAPAAPTAAKVEKKKEKAKKEKTAGGGLPGSAYAMMAIALLAAVGCVFIFLEAATAKERNLAMQTEFDTRTQSVATMKEQIPQTQQAILELDEGKATLLENLEFKICNLSRGPIDVSWWQVSYVGPDEQIQSFNSADYGYPNWRIEAGQTGKNSYTVDDQTLWDGSAVFFAATVNYRGQETLRSGALQTVGPNCYNLRLD